MDHSLADGGYNARRAECERALEICRRRFPSLPALAGLEPEALSDVMTELPPPLDRRVRHVVSETARTRRAAAALDRGDLAEVGRLMVEGHESLRDDYECSVAQADALVEAALEHGALGARLTGAGWGGSVIMLAPKAVGEGAATAASEHLARRFGPAPAALVHRRLGRHASRPHAVGFAAAVQPSRSPRCLTLASFPCGDSC